MPQMLLKDITLAFTNCMTRESEYGGWSYSFIIDENDFCDKVRACLATQKSKQWNDEENTNSNIIKRANLKRKDDVTHEPTRDIMKDTDLLVTVKSKTAAITNTEGCSLARGTTADVLIDPFEFVYNKKKMICIRSHADRGCTVKVNKLVEFTGGTQYFEVKNAAEQAFDAQALAEVNVPF